MSEERLEIGSTYVLKKEDFNTLLSRLTEKGYETIGAKVENETLVYDRISTLEDFPQGYVSEQEAGHFRLTKTNHERYFDYIPGAHSWKQFLFPSRTELFTLRKNDNWQTELPSEEQPKYAFIGVRGCELSAIQIQDDIFMRDDFTDPIYAKRRQNLFILSINCLHPANACFCTSMQTGPKAGAGFDLSLTELDDVFLLEVGSEMGRLILNGMPLEAASAFVLQAAQKGLERAARQMTRELDTSDLPELLTLNLNHPHWHEIAERCLSCGSCTQVCPTCFCWDTVDTSDVLGKETKRERVWDSCFNIGYSYQAGGNTRPTIHSRYRQWLSHKLGTWVEQNGTLGCVGCGRCIVWCPAGIDLTEEVPVFREDKKA
ncbi:MAG: 4Fe-4S dicluster domain-containing protein [Anaerolineae bacterium]|jgi:sulfhydrogenase subunit beta (sulfur reductase)|nr:4Fe-4S dicluster domain-containing protein [Anaerolineae bacterium]MBT7189164.1 4Fe-4S dicluster domain-containing protein [Anaerolineae bacterium]MBT7988663.1 4Fe-4S dicluster domain-containing protein [Anaerolineae bacterium]